MGAVTRGTNKHHRPRVPGPAHGSAAGDAVTNKKIGQTGTTERWPLPHCPITGAGDPWRGAGPAPNKQLRVYSAHRAPARPRYKGAAGAAAAEAQGKMPRCDTGCAPRDGAWGQVRGTEGTERPRWRRRGHAGSAAGLRSRDRRCHAPVSRPR